MAHEILSRLRFVHRAWRYRLRVEREEVRFLLRYLDSTKSTVDVGAHKGALTYWMARKTGRRARVFAFEPLPHLAGYLRHMREVFPLPQTVVEQAALSDREGPRTLMTPRADIPGLSTLVESTPNAGGWDEIKVETLTLDSYFDRERNRPIGFIKCDVEGHEIDVLRGGERLLAEDRPVLLVECEDHRNGGGQRERLTSYLDELGYDCFILRSGGVVPLSECRAAIACGETSPGQNLGFLPRARARLPVTPARVAPSPFPAPSAPA